MAVRKKHAHQKSVKKHRNRALHLADKEPRPRRILLSTRKFLSTREKPSPPAASPRVVPANGTDKARAPAITHETDRDRNGYDSDTAIKLYLREIGQVKLLTPSEEVDLAAK